ncbi:MAG: hypothetical protein U9Q83_04105 [Bacteroidota bacterium]|nr:hypothetical protein [Bacteroidota bacterium]
MTYRKKLNLGQSDFKNIINTNSYFIDKSLLIEEIIDTEKSVFFVLHTQKNTKKCPPPHTYSLALIKKI